jgi:hypothetical protein
MQPLRLLTAMVLAAMLLWAGFTTFVMLGDNYQRVLPGLEVVPDVVDWQMLVGDGALDEDGFVILGATERAHALLLAIRLPRPVEAATIDRVELFFQPGVQYRRMNLGWSENATFPARRMGPIEMISDTRGVVNTSWLPNWGGELHFLAVELIGGLADPVTLRRIELTPARPGFFELQSRLLGEWFEFPPWTQRSAHHTRVSLQHEILSPVTAVAAWAGLSVLLLLVVPWLRAGFPLSLLLLVPVAVGWFVLDLRWQADLVGKAWRAVDSFAGSSWQERNEAEFDGDLFRLVEDLRDIVGDPAPRLFAVGYGEFWRLRARYHAGAWPVRTTDRPLGGWVRDLHEGDLLMLLDAPDVERVELRESERYQLEPDLLELSLEAIAGVDAELTELGGEEVLGLRAGGRQLLRAAFPAAPASGVHAVSVSLASAAESTTALLRVRRRAGDGGWVDLVERSLVVEGADFRIGRLAFPIERGGMYEVVVFGEQGAELYASGLQIESLEEEELVYLRSGSRGAGVIARPVLERQIGSVYEIF